MIQVKIKQTRGEDILDMKISGHADYDKTGKDLVCAAVSAISVGGLNALADIVGYTIKDVMEPGYVSIEVLKIHPIQQIILKTLLSQFMTISITYGEYIQIEKQEV